MFEKKYYQNLNTLRNKIKISSKIEMQEIDYVLKWLKKRNLKNKMKVKKIKVKGQQVKGSLWVSLDTKGTKINEINISKKLKEKQISLGVIDIHRIKWCCIILSEILNKNYSERRYFAGHQINANKCLKKAKKYYNQHLKKIN